MHSRTHARKAHVKIYENRKYNSGNSQMLDQRKVNTRRSFDSSRRGKTSRRRLSLSQQRYLTPEHCLNVIFFSLSLSLALFPFFLSLSLSLGFPVEYEPSGSMVTHSIRDIIHYFSFFLSLQVFTLPL